MTPKEKSPRLEVVDAVRGLAVVFMIQWHTAEGWVREPERSGSAFWVSQIVGGMAAPFFFLLAGLGAGMSEKLPASRKALGAAVRRGLGIVVAGYGLRTYAWAVDHSALVDPAQAPVCVLFAVALGLLWVGLERPDSRWVGAGALLAALAIVFMSTPRLALGLDVLHGIGVALVIVACVLASSSRLSDRVRPIVTLTFAIVVALTAPHLVAMRPPPGPVAMWDWVARFDVSPDASGARFPIVPWLGHALVGATLGRALRGRGPHGGVLGLPIATSPLVVTLVATLVAVTTFEAGPIATIVLRHAEWARGVDRIVFYASTATALAGLVAWRASPSGRIERTLTLLGRHSLVIYAVHLEIAYGLPGSLVRHALGWWSWAALALCLFLSMIALAHGIERFQARKHERSARSPA
jgi:uncharacterized membrane protein